MDNTLRRALWEILRPLIQLITNLLNPEIGEEWMREFKRFLRREPCWVVVAAAIKETKVYLRRLYETETITVGAVTGTEDLAQLFPGGIYGDAALVEAASANTSAATAMKVAVHEMIEDGAYKPVFESLGPTRQRLASLRQVGVFCRDNRGKLRTGGYGTLFELEGDLVAHAYVVGHGRLILHVHPFSHDRVWNAKYQHRVVSPQLAA